MEQHKDLYKEQRTHTPRQLSRINRKIQEDKRAKNRRDRFQNSRNLPSSPVRQLKDESIAVAKTKSVIEEGGKLIICNATNEEELTKQEAYIKKFIDWKEKKKNSTKPEKKKPFITSVGSGWQQATNSSTIVPIGHHKEFRPPAGLKKVNVEEVGENNNRRSIYTIVPTPPKKQIPEKATKNVTSTKKALETTQNTNMWKLNKTQNGTENLTKSTKKSTVSNNLHKKTPANVQKQLLKKSPSASAAKNTAVKVVKTLEKSKTKAKPVQMPVNNNKELKPRSLKMPPPTITVVSLPKKATGAIAKIKTLAEKNKENVKPKRKSPLKRANLSQNLKAKKPLNYRKTNISALKLNNQKVLNIIKSGEPIQTPKDFATLNPFAEFITSTKLKDSSENIQIVGISPIKPTKKILRNNSSAKRNILANNDDLNSENPTNECSPKNVKRFNFLRYSGAAVAESEMKNELISNEEGEKTLIPQPANTEEITPIKSGAEERPANYLSPFVSVSRGKVSLKKEKEKRNSIYLQDATESNDLPTQDHTVEVRRTLESVRYFRKQLQDEIDRLHQLCDVWEEYKNDNLEKIQNANGEDMINVTIGQTRLLTSKKFMQFKGLIERCEARATGVGDVKCDGSEATKTITTVDLEGFWSMLGLQVDNLNKRFESLNRWKANDWIDPDEVKPKKTKLTKIKKSFKAEPAARTKANPALQQMLRKMQAEMRKNKDNNDDTNGIVILTSSKQKHSTNSNNSPSRKSLDANASCRLTVKVRDRKYFSPAATVLTFSSPTRRRSLRNKSLLNSNENLVNMPFSPSLRKSVLLNEKSRRDSFNSKSPIKKINSKDSQVSVETNNKIIKITEANEEEILKDKSLSPQSPIRKTPPPNKQKSILKTPGTARTKLHNVIFNDKLRVRKFNFLINDNDDNEDGANNSHEEELAKTEDDESSRRMLTLRNRTVRLRPSSEIIIPKK